METIAKVRRYYFADGKIIIDVNRLLRLSRNTVRKVIRSGATEHRHQYEKSTDAVSRRVLCFRLETLLEGGPATPQETKDNQPTIVGAAAGRRIQRQL